MTDYTRLTIIGSSRRADMVVPGDQPVGSLIPRLMELLDERPGAVSRPLALVRATGEQLDATLTVAEQSVFDGEMLRLLREDAAPPPPEVADVTDVLAEAHDDRGDLWSLTARRTIAAVGTGAATATAGLLALDLDPATGLLGAAIAWLLGAVVAVVAGRARGTWLAVAATALSVGAAVPLALALAAGVLATGSLGAAAPVLIGTALVWISLGLGAGAGLGSRPAWWGAVIGAMLAALPVLLVHVGVERDGAAGVGVAAATLVCGLLPWYAMTASGLTGLDDQVVEGRLKRRDQVLVTVSAAYRTLTWSTFAVAVPLGVLAAALLAAADPWAIALGGTAVIATAARTRAMPLAAQCAVLWLAAGGALLAGAALQIAVVDWAPIVVLGAVVLAAIVGGAVTPPEHRRASLRRIGDLAEALAVAAMLPVLLGVFGVYTDLLGAFG